MNHFKLFKAKAEKLGDALKNHLQCSRGTGSRRHRKVREANNALIVVKLGLVSLHLLE